LTRHKSNPNFKRKLRTLNLRPFLLNKETAQVVRIERDPNRSAFIGLCRLLRSGFLSYLPISNGTRPGDYVYINPSLTQIENNGLISVSNRKFNTISPLYALPKGSLINNITSSTVGQMVLCRSAGSRAKLLSFSSNKQIASLLMPSGKTIYLNSSCYASSGIVSNPNYFLNKKVKAGQNR
jgi:large subunit ribosomal protein L2